MLVFEVGCLVMSRVDIGGNTVEASTSQEKRNNPVQEGTRKVACVRYDAVCDDPREAEGRRRDPGASVQERRHGGFGWDRGREGAAKSSVCAGEGCLGVERGVDMDDWSDG